MRLAALITTVAVCAAMAGCNRIKEAALPVPAKINAAYPSSTDLRAAQERLTLLLADDPKATSALQAQTESRMALRALACSQNVSVGRLDSIASVRSLGLDRGCFQAQDKELQKFFGLRTIGVLLARPPLRPLKPAGPMAMLPRGKLSPIVYGNFAREAGVAVLRDSIGDGAAVEIPGGKVITQLPRASGAGEHATRLSPNGQMLAVNSMQDGLTFYETETGSRIWEASDGGHLLAWLPEVGGFILAARQGTMLADAQNGTMEAHPQAPANSAFSASIPGQSARTLIGTARDLALLEHTRTATGIAATEVKRYAIGAGPGITSGNPVPMQSGRLVVYASMRDIGWLDLESGSSGTWRTSPLFGIPFAKLDESHIMFDSVDGERMALKPWSFDIAAETVAAVDLGSGDRGLLINTGDRIGFMRRGNDAWFGDAPSVGEPQALDRVVAAYQLEMQLRKLQQQMQAEEASARAEAAAARPSAEATPGMRTRPGPRLDLPPDAQLHMVGVYESMRRRDVRVLARPGRPLVLVLASHEPVNWMVSAGAARLVAVLLSGHPSSTVNGVVAATVIRIGSASAYASRGADYEALRSAVAQYTGPLEVRSFQGEYSAAHFNVGGY